MQLAEAGLADRSGSLHQLRLRGDGQLTWRLPSALAARAQLGSRDSLGICPVQKLASASKSTRLGICPVPQAVPNYRWTIVRNGRRTRSCS